MSAQILVGYATRYGSTQEVAEAVTATLREGGLAVDLRPLEGVRALDGYGAVVLGAPLYIGRWHKEMRRFLEGHQEGLSTRPVAIFTLGPTQGGPEEWGPVQDQLDQELACYAWLDPLATTLFGGKYDPSRLRLADKLLTILPASPLHQMPANDLRDWTAIRAWAQALAAQLQPAAAA